MYKLTFQTPRTLQIMYINLKIGWMAYGMTRMVIPGIERTEQILFYGQVVSLLAVDQTFAEEQHC